MLEGAAEIWNCTYKKLARKHMVDAFFYYNHDLVAVVEAKRRFVDKHRYPTYTVSKKKILAGQQYARTRNIPFLLLVKWEDAQEYTRILPAETFDMALGGRYDRGLEQDVEAMCHIPLNRFEPYENTQKD